MCKYCEEDKRKKRDYIINTPIVSLRIIRNNGFNALAIKSYNLEKQVVDSYQIINYCPKCRKEAGRVKHILDYGLELENVKENELPDKDNEIIIQFNNILSEKYGLFEVDVLENDNLYFRGRITSSTKSENNAKLKLLIAELNEFYNKYNLKKVIKSMIAYGNNI